MSNPQFETTPDNGKQVLLMDSLHTLRSKWARAARWYDLATVPLELLLLLRPLRSKLLRLIGRWASA